MAGVTGLTLDFLRIVLNNLLGIIVPLFYFGFEVGQFWARFVHLRALPGRLLPVFVCWLQLCKSARFQVWTNRRLRTGQGRWRRLLPIRAPRLFSGRVLSNGSALQLCTIP